MVTNLDKFQVIFPGTERSSNNVIKIGDLIFPSTEEVKLLGITFDRQLTFYPHIQNMCKAASNKIKALLRIRSFLTQNQTDLILNAYVFSAFNYCPLVWMFCSKKAHNLIDKTFYRALCAKYYTFSHNFSDLLKKANMPSIHVRNLRLLVIEIFKSINRLNPELMWDTFPLKTSKYYLRQGSSLMISPNGKSARGINSFNFRAALAWNHLPASIKNVNNLSKFKALLKDVNIYCQCKLCTA